MDGTILLVEDEDEIRKLFSLVLCRKGYAVISAADPMEALMLIEQGIGPIRLLISDVVMPGMTGPELWFRIRERAYPCCLGAKVLFLSGKRSDPAIGPSIQKPCTHYELLEKVEELLAA